MKVKKAAVLIVLALGVAFVGSQAAYTKPEKAKAAYPQGVCVSLWKVLDLTDAQKAAAKQIFEAKRDQTKAVWSDESLAKEQKRAMMKEIQQAGMADFRQLLSPEQQQKLDEVRIHARKHYRPRDAGLRADLQKAAATLNLTPEQKAAIKQIMLSRKPQVEALKADQSLTPEQKKAAFNEIRLAVQAEIKALLTPEQQQKFDELAAKAQTRYRKRIK